MNDAKRRGYEMFQRVRNFGAEQSADFPANTLGRELFAVVASGVEDLGRHAAAQATGSTDARQATDTKGDAREALRQDLEEINRTARSMAIEFPDVGEKFRLPRFMNDQQLLETARTFMTEAAPITARFIRYEMPANFLDDLDTDIAAFEAANRSQDAGLTDQASATESIDETYERTMDAIRRLNAIVRNKYRNNRAVLAAWARARHVERPPRPSTPPATTNPTNPNA